MDDDQPKLLIGYVSHSDHGFALPCFATTVGSNAFYVARCHPDRDHCGKIAGFEPFMPEGLIRLPPASVYECRVKDPWVDVFLWNGGPLVGTPQAIWQQIQPDIANVRRSAPLTLLDLALDVTDEGVTQLRRDCLAFLTERYGEERGEREQNAIVRQQVRLVLTRLMADAHRDRRLAAEEITVRFLGDERYQITLAEALWQLPAPLLAETEEKLAGLGDRLGLLIGVAPPSAHEAPAEYRAEPSPEAEQPDSEAPVSDAAPGNVLIAVFGRRAKAIARHLSRPAWSLLEHGEELHAPKRIVRNGERVQRDEARLTSVFHVVDDGKSFARLDDYAAVILLADDEIITGEHPGHDSLAYLRLGNLINRMPDNVPRIAAPALPARHPARSLVPPFGIENFALFRRGLEMPRFTAILDTSFARSPFWRGNVRRSLDRRIADILMDAGTMLAGREGMSFPMEAFRGAEGRLLLSVGVSSPDSRNPRERSFAYTQMLSEANWVEEGRSTIQNAFRRPGKGKDGKPVECVVRLQDRFGRFSSMARASLLEAAGIPLDGHRLAEMPVDTRLKLRYPEHAAAFRLNNGPADGILVLGEGPSLSVIETAAESGLLVVRYTDRAAIREVFSSPQDLKLPWLPNEIEIPPIHRLRRNQGLAVRGIDPRDVLRIPQPKLLGLAGNEESFFESSVRRYRASLAPSGEKDPEMIVPWADLAKALAQNDPVAHQLTSVTRDRNRAGKRVGDLRLVWQHAPSDMSRYIVADGVLPVTAGRIENDEAPSQNFFMLSGNDAVPALMGSRVFAIWARATLSRSTSWMSRFSVSRTFETFPISKLFEVRRTPAENTFLAFANDRGRFARLARSMIRQESAARDDGLGEIYESSRHEVDEMILESYGLFSHHTDLEILKELLEWNQKMNVSQ